MSNENHYVCFTSSDFQFTTVPLSIKYQFEDGNKNSTPFWSSNTNLSKICTRIHSINLFIDQDKSIHLSNVLMYIFQAPKWVCFIVHWNFFYGIWKFKWWNTLRYEMVCCICCITLHDSGYFNKIQQVIVPLSKEAKEYWTTRHVFSQHLLLERS